VSPELYSAVLGGSGPGGAAPRGQRRRGGGGVARVELAVLLAVPEQWRAAAQPGGDAGTVVNPRVFDEADRAASEARWARELGVGRAHPRSARRSRGARSGSWVRAAGPERLVLGAASADAPALIGRLAAHPRVAWVEPREVPRLRNKWAKGIVQSGDAAKRVLFERGLMGQGEIVGIADTGVEMQLCFFADSKDTPYNIVDKGHRKVVSYRYDEDWGSTRDEEGHGSHTAGSICGAAWLQRQDPARLVHPDVAEYNGTAPEAKLIFDDIYKDDELAPPDDLYHDLFRDPYNAGARIRSESWGGDSIFYTLSAREVATPPCPGGRGVNPAVFCDGRR
jgi:hypothetical protein